MARVFLGAVLALSGWAGLAHAQVASPGPESLSWDEWQLAPLLEARARGEYRHDLDARDRGLLVERARFGLDVQRGCAEGRVVLQDARVLNLSAGSDVLSGPASVAVTGAYEAWGEAHSASVHPSFVRLGRQAITWGEGRLLGSSDWAPAGRTLDAARARLVARETAFEGLVASLSEASGAPGQAYGELFGGRAEWFPEPLFAVEAYVLGRVAQENPASALEGTVRGETYTGSLRLHGDSTAWTWGVEGAYQLGRAADLHRERRAVALAGHVARTFEHALLVPTVRVGLSYASGDGGGSVFRAFDPLFPDAHKWHGAMDLFAWSNEEEASVKAAIVPFADGTASVAYRYARLADPGGSWRSGYLATLGRSTGNTRSELGHEVDAEVTWSPLRGVELAGGYSMLVVGAGARALLEAKAVAYANGAPPALSHFAYAQALIRIP